MFQITRYPSSGSSLQCLAKNYSNGSIFSIDMDSRLCNTHKHHRQICCHNTDYVHINGRGRTITVILTKHCIELPDDGPLVIRNMLEQF